MGLCSPVKQITAVYVLPEHLILDPYMAHKQLNLNASKELKHATVLVLTSRTQYKLHAFLHRLKHPFVPGLVSKLGGNPVAQMLALQHLRTRYHAMLLIHQIHQEIAIGMLILLMLANRYNTMLVCREGNAFGTADVK